MKHLTACIASVLLGLSFSACDVDRTREGEAPNIDIDPGRLPEYDVDTPEVEVGTERREVEVPDIDVNSERREIEVPDIDVRMPSEDNEREPERNE
jgi:hypothetical protein